MECGVKLVLRMVVLWLWLGILSACSNDADSLIWKIKNGDHAGLEDLLKADVNPNRANFDGDTPLGGAVQVQDVEFIRILLRHGADPNLKDSGNSPLYIAALLNCEECATLLLQAGGKLNADESAMKYLEKYDHVRSEFWQKILGD
jgi:ankyrin repeat protein